MSYASDSAADRLAAVRAAIDRCLTSQEYRVGDRQKVMAELKELRAMERELQREAGQQGGGFTVGQLDFPG